MGRARDPVLPCIVKCSDPVARQGEGRRIREAWLASPRIIHHENKNASVKQCQRVVYTSPCPRSVDSSPRPAEHSSDSLPNLPQHPQLAMEEGASLTCATKDRTDQSKPRDRQSDLGYSSRAVLAS